MQAYARFSPGTSKWNKHTVAQHISIGGNGPLLVGTASQVADGLETWVREADVDGFNLVSVILSGDFAPPINPSQAYVLFPQTFKDIIDLLVPELRRRGLFWDDYKVPGGTYRENFYQVPGQSGPPKDHPAASYRWRAGVDAKDAPVPT